jgi:hypothetical protein
VLTSDQEIGLARKFHSNFAQTYFNDRILRHDAGDMPADRQRARDVVRYRWHDGALALEEHSSVTITNRADIAGKRDHARVRLLEDPEAAKLVETLLRLVPPDRRQADGTFGINLFRTFTNVVTKPHHDKEEYIILYVLDRVGEGAESYLYHPGDVDGGGRPAAEPAFRYQLNPGDILMFEDKRFKHGATPLKCPQGETARRDVLICTVDCRSTYLEAESDPEPASGHRSSRVPALSAARRAAGSGRAAAPLRLVPVALTIRMWPDRT